MNSNPYNLEVGKKPINPPDISLYPTKKRNQEIPEEYKKALKNSVAVPNNTQNYFEQYTAEKELYKKRRGLKPKKTLFKTLAAITAIGILIGFTPKIVNEIKRQNFVSEVADEVTDNIIYNVNGTWDYRPTWIIAKGVLDTNKNIDIDTRIYSCYERLNPYKKNTYMNSIMAEMQKEVLRNPEKYSEAEINACNFATFDEYIMHYGLEKDEYLSLMQDVTKAYANNDLDRVSELLSGLKGGSR